ncbi:RtcB family protein [Corallococcus sp. 4LFB]|uniref:RtcB family protein n=1 Tax=Corallococcus sp. 4LFB TaxID=3383249 RepID=UPI0039751944
MMPRVLEVPPGAVAPPRLGAHVPAAALKQLQQLAAQPYVTEHVAVMPDVHLASGVAVGTVFATQAHVVPGALATTWAAA